MSYIRRDVIAFSATDIFEVAFERWVGGAEPRDLPKQIQLALD